MKSDVSRESIPGIDGPATNGTSEGDAFVTDGASTESTFTDTVTRSGYESKPPTRRRWLRIAIVGAVLLIAAVVVFMLMQPAKGGATATVQRGTIISTVETTGKLQSDDSAKLAFKSSGRVAKVFYKQGD